MPSFGFSKHSNRSKQDLIDPTALGSGTPSSGGSADDLGASQARTNQQHNQAQNHQSRNEQRQSYILQQSNPDVERRTYEPTGDAPSRSHSTRYSAAPQPYPSSQGPPSQAGSSADDLALDARRLQNQGRRNTGQPLQQAQPANVEPKKKGFFSGLRSNKATEHKHSASQPPASSYNNTSGLARRISKKHQDSPSTIRTVQQVEPSQRRAPLDWGPPEEESINHLPSPLERVEDETGLDPYQIRDSQEQGYSGSQEQVQQHNIGSTQAPHQPQHHSAESTQQNRHHLQNPNYPQYNNPPGNLVIADQFRQQNPETVSQLSYESPTDQGAEQRPNSVQSNAPSINNYPTQRQDYQERSSTQGSRPAVQQSAMAPPPASSQQNRRSADAKSTLQGASDTREGQPPPSYQPRNQASTPGLSPHPSNVSAQGSTYRGGPSQREQFNQAGNGEQGRSTPPPTSADRDINDAYKELSTKYKKVKGLYFDKTAQVEQLQNTLANQRLSQSRTSLDDGEYMTRFQRLDGAITNLAFNIRKDWRSVPSWIAPYVNQDALKIGKQEMTAVGRSCITKFLVDEVFSKSFHPGLEPDLSTSLKAIEQNIRRFSPALNNQEEHDALTSKVVQWRLTTLDGLKDVLNSPGSEECRKLFTQMATTNMTASLINFLQDPPPPGIEDSAHMIVELAVGIASNIPLESRDISITYPMPGDALQPSLMKVGEGVPALETPGAEGISEGDSKSTKSGSSDDKESEKVDPKSRKEKTKSGMLQAMMNNNNNSAGNKKPVGPENTSAGEKRKNSEDGTQKVRFSGFIGVEVRGRQILNKAPVWTVS